MNISIALTTYNGGKFLWEQLESFLIQTRPPDELVVCDDCSTDLTVDILEKFAKIANFDVVIERNIETLGVTRNFEKAISMCNGELILLSDQDDYWFDTKIEVIEDAFRKNTDVMVTINDAYVTDSDMIINHGSLLSKLRKVGRSDVHLINGCCTAIRNSFVHIILPFPKLNCGYDTWIHTIAGEFKVRQLINTPLQNYRRHENTATDAVPRRGRLGHQLDLLKAHGFVDITEGWENNIRIIEEILRRAACKNHGYVIEVNKLKEMIAAYNFRIINNKRSGWCRWMYIIWGSYKGYYRSFNGWKSMLKDVVRARRLE